MKLFRFGNCGAEKPGALVEGERRIDVSHFGEDYDDHFFATDGLTRLAKWLVDNSHRCPAIDHSVRTGPCVCRPSKIVCVGLNYALHVAEGGAELPKEPVIFLKAPSAISGANDDVIIPKGSQKTDWEVELAVIIGKRATYLNIENAMDYVAGYCVHNDYSERSFQLERGGQWVKGKSCDSFAPLGPLLVTKEEITDPHALRLWLRVNGIMMQNSNTSHLIFRIPQLLSYITQFMTLLPGDVLSTGTPEGVGFGLKPPLYLRDGDIVEFGVEGLGSARQCAVAYDSKPAGRARVAAVEQAR